MRYFFMIFLVGSIFLSGWNLNGKTPEISPAVQAEGPVAQPVAQPGEKTVFDGTIKGFFPVYWWKYKEKSGEISNAYMVFPVFVQGKTSFAIWPVIMIFGDFNFIVPIFWYEEQNQFGKTEIDSYGVFPLFCISGDNFFSLLVASWHRSESYQEWTLAEIKTTRVVGLCCLLFNYHDEYQRRFLAETRDDTKKLLMQIKNALNGDKETNVKRVIEKGSKLLTSPQQAGFNALDNIEKLNIMKQEIEDKYVKKEPSVSTTFSLLGGLLYSYEYSSDWNLSSFDILYGIIFTNQKDNQKEDLRFFYYLYRDMTNEANERSIDVFPFINIFSTPNQEKVTWLWKVLGYSTDLKTDETTYYLFFCEF